jgi:hypothetical protein
MAASALSGHEALLVFLPGGFGSPEYKQLSFSIGAKDGSEIEERNTLSFSGLLKPEARCRGSCRLIEATGGD